MSSDINKVDELYWQDYKNSLSLYSKLFKPNFKGDVYSSSKRKKFMKSNENKWIDNNEYWAEWNKRFSKKLFVFRNSWWCHFCHNNIWQNWAAELKHIIPTYVYIKNDFSKYLVWKRSDKFLEEIKYIKLDLKDWIHPLLMSLYRLR